MVAFTAHFIATGAGFYSFSVFFKPLIKVFDCSREDLGYASSIALVVGAIWAPILGRLVDRTGPRIFMMFGSLAVGSAFILMSLMESIWQFYLLFGVLLALGHSAMGGIPANWSIASWFVRRMGLAMGIATMGVSFSGFIMPIVVHELTERYGWRMALIALGFLAWIVVLPIVSFLMKRSPEDVGLRPDGDDPAEEALSGEIDEPRVGVRAALKMPTFWKIQFGFGMAYLPLGTMLMHQIAFLTDIGISSKDAAIILALCAASATVGKFIFGLAMDYLDKRTAIIFSFAVQALGIFLLIHAKTEVGALIFALTYGFGMGGLIPLHQSSIAHFFGRKSFGSMAGIGRPIIVCIQFFGQPFAGRVFDTTGNYNIAFYTFIGAFLLGIIIISTLHPRTDKGLKPRGRP